MAIKLSRGVVNALAMGMGWGDIIRNSVCVVYAGAQPSTADIGATGGSELCRFWGSATPTAVETRATALIDFTNTTGNCTALTVGGTSIISGAVTYSTPTALAAAVAANINSYWTYPDYRAVVGGTTVGAVTYGSDAKIVYIIAPKNSGISLNGLTVATTVAAGTAAINGGSSTTLGGTGSTAGIAAAGTLDLTYPADTGMVSKSGTWQTANATQTVTGTAGGSYTSGAGGASASGTAVWFRLICNPNYDTGLITLSTTNDDAYLIHRIDGSVGTSGADMLVTSSAITSGVSQTVTSFTLTVPSI